MEGACVKWRARAKCVAYGDLYTTASAAAIATFCVILVPVVQDIQKDPKAAVNFLFPTSIERRWPPPYEYPVMKKNLEVEAKQVGPDAYAIWLSFAVIILLSGIQALCIVKLIQSTDRTISPEKALFCARFWGYFSPLYLLVPGLISLLYAMQPMHGHYEIYILCGLYVAIRGVMFYIVVRFIRQLKITIAQCRKDDLSTKQ